MILALLMKYIDEQIFLHLQNRKTAARSRPRRPPRQLTVSRLSLDSSCFGYSITSKVISDNQSSSASDSFF
jgi:hypothetical protein